MKSRIGSGQTWWGNTTDQTNTHAAWSRISRRMVQRRVPERSTMHRAGHQQHFSLPRTPRHAGQPSTCSWPPPQNTRRSCLPHVTPPHPSPRYRAENNNTATASSTLLNIRTRSPAHLPQGLAVPLLQRRVHGAHANPRRPAPLRVPG